MQEETKHIREKNRKAKESTRKLFCVSLFLAKWGEKSTREGDIACEGTKTSTEPQIHANYLTLLLCGAAGSARQPNHDFISQPSFHLFFFSYKVHCSSILL